ncbi:recombinase family protein [Paenibacillus alginolyticus]|uniref:recombinase family protein n=1 Tax=Paenibacillus alginolyticus TaxID=59839 RepID=UPI000415D8EF|nr:recombinase family protein [Paenibacillus alginolyticus]MCY9664915.1 recombinase family protein [Paenibacillus alginolyticus]
MSQKRAAIYILVEKQSRVEEAIERQKIACEQYAESAQLKVVKIYSDVSHSTTLNQRPMFQKLLSESKNALFDLIIVQRADRIGDMLDVAIYKKRLMNNGVDLVIAEHTMKESPEELIRESILQALIVL